MSYSMLRNIILLIGWPVLIAGSIFIFIKGHAIYKLVKGSLVGRITKVLVLGMLIEMYSLGIVATVYIVTDVHSVRLVVPVFLSCFGVFIWTIRALAEAQREAHKLTQQEHP